MPHAPHFGDFVPPGPPRRGFTGREIAVHVPFSDTAVRLRQAAAPGGWFDGDRRLWILLPDEAHALTEASIRELRSCLQRFGALPRDHTGKRRAMRATARDLRGLLAALRHDRRVWTPAMLADYQQLLVDLREHDAIADPTQRLW